MPRAVTKTVYIVRHQMQDYQFNTLAAAERFEAVNSIMDSASAFSAHYDCGLNFEDSDSVEKFFTRNAETIIQACKVLTGQK